MIIGIFQFSEDLNLRVHHRSMMEAAGLQRILQLCESFGYDTTNKHVEILKLSLEDDEKALRERMDQDILKDLANPEDVYKALLAKTQNSKAKDYLLSMFQHLLLVREDGPALAHYYQLIDSMVTDLVMDKQLGGGESRLGHSVERIIAQFNEADRHQHLEDELSQARATILSVKLEKETLEEEVSQIDGGLVGTLKVKVLGLEEKLKVSRENTSKLQGQLEAQKAGYEEQIDQLEAQIMELFRMLKEVDKGVNQIMESSVAMDRKTLIDTLEKHLQRDKTIGILEGRDKHRKKKRPGQGIDGDSSGGSEEEEETPTKAGSLRRRHASISKSRTKSTKATRFSEAQNGRSSQFMDADESIEQEQFQQQLAEGVRLVSALSIWSSPTSKLCRSIRQEMGLPQVPEVYPALPVLLGPL